MTNLSKWFNRLQLSTRLLIHMVIWAILFFIIVCWSFYSKTTLEKHFINTSNNEFKMYSLGVCMNQSLLSMLNAIDNHISTDKLDQKTEIQKTIKFLEDKITAEIVRLDQLDANEDLKQKFKSKLDEWDSVKNEIIAKSSNNETDKARHLLSSKGRDLVVLLNTILSSMHSEQKNSSVSGYDLLETHLHKVSYLCILSLLFIGLLNFAILLSVYRSILNPLKSIEVVADKVKQGDYSTRVKFKKFNYELTGLSQVFNSMLDRIEHHEQEHVCIEKNMELTNNLLNERNIEMEDFVKVVAHDIKSPLTTIEMFTEVIERDLLTNPDRAKNEVERIKIIVNRLRNLVDDLSHFALLGTKEEKKERINVSLLFKDVLEVLGIKPKKKSSSFKDGYEITVYELPSKKNIKVFFAKEIPFIYGDYWKYSQIFLNLLTNAVKFKSDKPLEITLNGYYDNGFAVIYVKDNGIGIDKTFTSKIFNMCYRLVTYEQIEGTGVGLAIVKKIVNGYGGSVWAESEGKGKGTAFYIRVPSVNG